eukprot:758684-Hanusia_phi.AAC.11
MTQEDFAMNKLLLHGKNSVLSMNKTLVKGHLSESSCINYELDLSLHVQKLTIPRCFVFTVSPGGYLNMYCDVEAHPCEQKYTWKADYIGGDKIITESQPSSYELKVDINGQQKVLKDAAKYISRYCHVFHGFQLIPRKPSFQGQTKSRQDPTWAPRLPPELDVPRDVGELLPSLSFPSGQRRRRQAT